MGWRRTGLAFLLATWLAGPSAARAEDILAAVDMNGQPVSDGELVEKQGDQIIIPIGLARKLRLHLPANAGDRIVLNGLAGVEAVLDPLSQTLHLKVDPQALERTEIGGFLTNRPYDRPTETGFFGNYTLLGEAGGGATNFSGLFDLGTFGPYGTATTDISTSTDTGAVRLQSHFERDLGGGNTLTLGDGFLFQGAIGQAFPYGGIGITSRTAATGGHATTPVQSILGQAALPSTVDIFVNNALQSHQSIDAGPFAVQDLPTVTGQGEVRIVVRDVLGREQVLTRSFFGSTRLLADDAEEYGVETGFLRENYGATSWDYAEPFTAGTWRRGLTPDFTIELHGEGSTKRQGAGAQGSLEVGNIGVLRLGGAYSNAYLGTGELVTAGFDSQVGRLNLGLSTSLVDGRYTQLGYDGEQLTKETTSAHASYDLKSLGSVDLSLLRFRTMGQRPSMTAAAGYSLSIGNRAFFEFSLSDNIDTHDVGGMLTFSIAFDGINASATSTRSDGKWQSGVEASMPIQGDQGIGYDATVQQGVSDREEAGVFYRDDLGEFSAHAGAYNGSGAARLTATGSLQWLDGQFFTARQTTGGFAVVDTGEPGVHVTLDQQPQGVTDADGAVFIPHLRPGEVNHVAIDPEDVPLDSQLPETTREIVPRTATGYVIRFPVKHQHSATAILNDAAGKPLPLSAPVKSRRTGFESVVGHDGAIYLDSVEEGDVIEAGQGAAQCTATIHLPAAVSPQYQLGAIACR